MAEQKQEVKSKESSMKFKLFGMYDIDEVKIEDRALRDTINLKPKLLVKSKGTHVERMGKRKVNIIERLMNKLAVSGHRGKKHRLELGHTTGKYSKNMKIVLNALKDIEKKTGKNPLKVFVSAVENSAPRDEVTIIEYGGARYPQAVDVSPMRRVNLALTNITHGASDRAFDKKKTITQGLAEEIMLAAENNGESFAIKKKKESEKQADSAR